MSKFIKMDVNSIDLSLLNTTRQYLVGNLKKPQELTFVSDDRLEIGITEYKEFTFELPHKHNIATEYQLVLDGYTEYLDVETMEEYQFRKGDFYAINKDTSYAQKSSKDTKILFIKVPSVNDKIEIETNESIKKWLEKKI